MSNACTSSDVGSVVAGLLLYCPCVWIVYSVCIVMQRKYKLHQLLQRCSFGHRRHRTPYVASASYLPSAEGLTQGTSCAHPTLCCPQVRVRFARELKPTPTPPSLPCMGVSLLYTVCRMICYLFRCDSCYFVDFLSAVVRDSDPLRLALERTSIVWYSRTN